MGAEHVFPFGSPSVNGTVISVEDAMRDPTTITRTLGELLADRFWATEIFSPSGGVDGGAVLFERPNPLATDLYIAPEQPIRRIAPGDEVPEVGFTRGVPMVARPVEIGGGFKMTKKSVIRNDQGLLRRNIQRLKNTFVRDTERMALLELAAVIASEARTTPAGTTWAALNAITKVNRTGTSSPLSQLLAAQVIVDAEERGHVLDSVLLNTADWANLIRYYDNLSNVREAFGEAGFTNIRHTTRKTAGSALLYEKGGCGEWRNEEPLEEDSEYIKRRKTWWYQVTASPVMYVTDQFGMIELTGI